TVCTHPAQGACEVAECDGLGACGLMTAADGSICNDGDVCTSDDRCVSGLCTGTALPACVTDFLHFEEDFEICSWTLSGDWACGTPTSEPRSCFEGSGCLATKLGGRYSDNRTFDANLAESPWIDLSEATSPVLWFQ